MNNPFKQHSTAPAVLPTKYAADYHRAEQGIQYLQRIMEGCGFTLTQQAQVWKRINSMAVSNTKAIHAKIRKDEARKLDKALQDADKVPGNWSQSVIQTRSKKG